MQWPHPPPHDDPDFGDDEERRRRTSFIVLGVAIALVAVSVILLFWLKDRIAIQDCIAASHRNCVPLDVTQQ